MQIIEISPIPNQRFEVILNGLLYQVELRTIQDLTYMSVWVNDDILFYNQLCTPNNYVNPYNYLSVNGKFYFKAVNGEYPNYKNFGTTSFIYFLTPQEIAQGGINA